MPQQFSKPRVLFFDVNGTLLNLAPLSAESETSCLTRERPSFGLQQPSNIRWP